MTDLSAMGIGNKPCLDLKESVDNINDRFIPSLNKAVKGELALPREEFKFHGVIWKIERDFVPSKGSCRT